MNPTLTHEQILVALAAWDRAMHTLEESNVFPSAHMAAATLGAIATSSLSDVGGVTLDVAQAAIMAFTAEFQRLAKERGPDA